MTELEAEHIRMPFGVYEGANLGQIAEKDVLYVAWLAGRSLGDAYLAAAVAVLAGKHADRIAAKVAAGERPAHFDAPAAADSQAPRPKQLRLF